MILAVRKPVPGHHSGAAGYLEPRDPLAPAVRANCAMPRQQARIARVARVVRKFRTVLAAMHDDLGHGSDRTGLPPAQHRALIAIGEHPGAGVCDLAGRLGIRQPSASALIKALLRRQLVRVQHVYPDRRAARIHLQPAGEASLARLPRPARTALLDALVRLDPAELAALDSLLTTLVRHLLARRREEARAVAGARWPP